MMQLQHTSPRHKPTTNLTVVRSEPAPEQRSISDVPERVFVERRPESEYTEVAPANIDKLYRLLDGYYGMSNFIELFHCLPEVFAPIHEIASRVADARWELKRTYSDEVTYKDEAFNKLFSKPNPFMTIQQLTYLSVCYFLLTGRIFWSKNLPTSLEQNYKNILSWFVLPSQDVWVKQNKVDTYTCTELNDSVVRYELRDTLTSLQKRIFEPEYVIPVIQSSLRDPYNMNRAAPAIMGAEKAIKNLIPVYETRGVIYIKRGALGFIVSRKTDDSGTVALTSDETKQLHKDYDETYGVTHDKANLGITGQPIDYVAVGQTIKEMQPFDETLADAVAIYATLRVPRHLVPSKDQGTFSNTDAQMKGFYDDVIIPLATMFAEYWTVGMGFNDSRSYISPSYDHIDILQENKKLAAEVNKILADTSILLYEKGVLTKNERNAMLSLASVPDGDVYAGGEGNSEPLAMQLSVGAFGTLKEILLSTTMDATAKKDALVILFGIKEKDAKKLTKKNEADTATQQPGTPQKESPVTEK